MPQKHGAQLSKRQKTAVINQKKMVSTAIDDEDAYFGRVIKINMGRCVLNVWDHEKKRHIEVQARLPNKKKGFIKMNDLVNVAKSHPDWEVQIAVDSKTANELRKAKRISPELAVEVTGISGAGVAVNAAAQDGFEFDYDGVKEEDDIDEEAISATAATSSSKAKVEEDDLSLIHI